MSDSYDIGPTVKRLEFNPNGTLEMLCYYAFFDYTILKTTLPTIVKGIFFEVGDQICAKNPFLKGVMDQFDPFCTWISNFGSKRDIYIEVWVKIGAIILFEGYNGPI